MTRIITSQFLSRFNVATIARALIDANELVLSLPGKANLILEDLKDGKLRIQFEHKGLDPIRNTIEGVTNRLAIAFVIAAIIVGSSIALTVPTTIRILGYPAFGIIGFLIGAMLGCI